MTSDTIRVRSYERRRPGERRPKWVLVNHADNSVLVNIRRGRFSSALGDGKLYFKNDLKRWVKRNPLSGYTVEEWMDEWDETYVMLAVR